MTLTQRIVKFDSSVFAYYSRTSMARTALETWYMYAVKLFVNLRKNLWRELPTFKKHFFGDRLTIEVSRTSIHIIWCYYISIVRQVTGLLSSTLCENIVKKPIWKFTDIFSNQVPNFLNIFTEHGKIITDYTKKKKKKKKKKHRKNFITALWEFYFRAPISQLSPPVPWTRVSRGCKWPMRYMYLLRNLNLTNDIQIYFFSAYVKQIKVILSTVKKYLIFFTSDEYDLYFFNVANKGCFDNSGLNFFPRRYGMHGNTVLVWHFATDVRGGGRVERWSWVNFQFRGVLQFGLQ